MLDMIYCQKINSMGEFYMNIIRLLGWDTYQITAVVLWIVAAVAAIFPFWYWKKFVAWKKDEDEKTGFFKIWHPSTIFGIVLFILLGMGFWFLEDLLAAGRIAAGL